MPIEVDLALITYYDALLGDVERTIVNTAKHQDANTLYRLQTVPGIGKMLSRVLLYEIHDINRCPRVQDFVSSCRLVKCAKESAGKRLGTSGPKIGNPDMGSLVSNFGVGRALRVSAIDSPRSPLRMPGMNPQSAPPTKHATIISAR